MNEIREFRVRFDPSDPVLKIRVQDQHTGEVRACNNLLEVLEYLERHLTEDLPGGHDS